MQLYSEAEAKTKWCPFARNTADNMGSFNRNNRGDPVASCLCVGSACMAWNTAMIAGEILPFEASKADELIERYPEVYAVEGDGISPTTTRLRLLSDIGGCGLAGEARV